MFGRGGEILRFSQKWLCHSAKVGTGGRTLTIVQRAPVTSKLMALAGDYRNLGSERIGIFDLCAGRPFVGKRTEGKSRPAPTGNDGRWRLQD